MDPDKCEISASNEKGETTFVGIVLKDWSSDFLKIGESHLYVMQDYSPVRMELCRALHFLIFEDLRLHVLLNASSCTKITGVIENVQCNFSISSSSTAQAYFEVKTTLAKVAISDYESVEIVMKGCTENVGDFMIEVFSTKSATHLGTQSFKVGKTQLTNKPTTFDCIWHVFLAFYNSHKDKTNTEISKPIRRLSLAPRNVKINIAKTDATATELLKKKNSFASFKRNGGSLMIYKIQKRGKDQTERRAGRSKKQQLLSEYYAHLFPTAF